MNTYLRFVIIALVSVSLCACHDSDKCFSVGYINAYCKLQIMYLRSSTSRVSKNANGERSYYALSSDTLYLEFGTLTYSGQKNSVYCSSMREDKLLYDSLSALHHDTAFCNLVPLRHIPSAGAFLFPTGAPTADIESIEITCNRDWDALHPAGSSLNDIVLYMGHTLKPFIESGYDPAVSKSVSVVKLLSDMTPSDFELNVYALDYYQTASPAITFLSAPVSPDDRDIHIAVRTTDGSVYSDSFVIKH